MVGLRALRGRLLMGTVIVGLAVGTLASLGAATPAAAVPTASGAKCPNSSGTLKVGMSYFGAVGGALEGIGASQSAALVPADQAIVNGYKAGVKALNDAGGIDGCQVDPVIFGFSASGDFNDESQQECAAMTQDNKVVAMYAAAFETKVAVDCFAKAKVPLFQIGNNYSPTCATYQKYSGYLYNPPSIAPCRYASFVGIWKKAGLFPSGSKVGILVQDDGSGSNQNLANAVYGPQLKKLKIPYETFVYPGASSSATFAQTNSVLGNALLKFKTDGVNVVLFTPGGGQGVAAFTIQANTQGYFPTYGLTSADSLGNARQIAPNATMKGAIAISWAIADLPIDVQQALPANSAITQCAAWTPPSPAALTGSSTYCDYLNILVAAFAGAANFTPATLQKGIQGLGTSFVSSVTYDGKTRFGPKSYTGAYVAHVLTYDATTDSFAFKAGDKTPHLIP